MTRRILLAAAAAAALAAGIWTYAHWRGGMEAAEVVRKLSGLRLSVELFRQERKSPPASFQETLRAGTLEEAPYLKLPRHLGTASVQDTPAMKITDSGGWAYITDPRSPDFGLVYIDCSHKDERGRFWSEF